MKTKYKFIQFEKSGELFDKNRWIIKNNKSAELLGVVEFYPEWNQYTLFTLDGIVFSRSCLLDILDFMNQLEYYKERL